MDLEKAITTQEALEEVLKDRLKRAEDKYSKKYEGYLSPEDVEKLKKGYDKQIADLNTAVKSAGEKAKKYDADIAERDAKIKGYETSAIKARVAHEVGIAYDGIDFIKGDDEKSIRKSAEALKGLIGSNQGGAPLASSDTAGRGDDKTEAMRALANSLFSNE